MMLAISTMINSIAILVNSYVIILGVGTYINYLFVVVCSLCIYLNVLISQRNNGKK